MGSVLWHGKPHGAAHLLPGNTAKLPGTPAGEDPHPPTLVFVCGWTQDHSHTAQAALPPTAGEQHSSPHEASGIAVLLKYSRLYRNPSISAQPLIFAFPNSAAQNLGVIIECY